MTAETTQDVYALPEYAAFLAAIRAEPADDTPRLVVADWLQEHGEDERAEFIRVQCELARYGGKCSGPCGQQLCRRCHTMQEQQRLAESKAIEAAFAASVPDGVFWTMDVFPIRPDTAHVVARRGFAAEVTCPAADWIAHADAILARHPVERVTLTTWPTRAELAQCLRLHPSERRSGGLAMLGRLHAERRAQAVEGGATPYMEAYRLLFMVGPWEGVRFDPPSLPVPA